MMAPKSPNQQHKQLALISPRNAITVTEIEPPLDFSFYNMASLQGNNILSKALSPMSYVTYMYIHVCKRLNITMHIMMWWQSICFMNE